MYVKDCEVLSIDVETDIAEILEQHQREMVEKGLELSDAEARVKVAEALFEAEKKENELASTKLINKMNLQGEEARRKLDIQSEVNRKQEAEKLAAKQAEKDMQVLIDAIHEADLARKQKDADMRLVQAQNELGIQQAKQKSYADTVAKIMNSISPDLVAALTSQSNAQVMETVANAVGPYAIANGESIADTANKLLRGTSLEGILKDVAAKE